MICSRESLKEYLEQDRLALNIERKKPRVIGDEIWKFQIALRKYEYYLNVPGGVMHKFRMVLAYMRYHRLAVVLGLTIPPNVFDGGLSIAHAGSIVINNKAKVGQNAASIRGSPSARQMASTRRRASGKTAIWVPGPRSSEIYRSPMAWRSEQTPSW